MQEALGLRKTDPRRAIALFNEALRIDGGLVRHEDPKFRAAAARFLPKVVQKAPDQPGPRIQLARHHYVHGELREAVREFAEARWYERDPCRAWVLERWLDVVQSELTVAL